MEIADQCGSLGEMKRIRGEENHTVVSKAEGWVEEREPITLSEYISGRIWTRSLNVVLGTLPMGGLSWGSHFSGYCVTGDILHLSFKGLFVLSYKFWHVVRVCLSLSMGLGTFCRT